LGLVEGIVSLSLTRKEREFAEFLLGFKPPAWTASWRISAIATAVAFAAVLLGGSSWNAVGALALAVSLGCGLPILGGTWPATTQGMISGKLAPISSCFPASYWKSSRVMLKINVSRLFLYLPLAMLAGLLGAQSAQKGLLVGCLWVGRASLFFLALIPVLIVGKFSKSSNDTAGGAIRAIAVLSVFVLVLIVLLGIGAAAIFTDGLWSVGFFMIELLSSVTIWALYGWYYERGGVDLLTERR